MTGNKLTQLDKALEEKQKAMKEADIELEKIVKLVQKIDIRIGQQEKVLEKLEQEKQKALEKVRDEFELYIRTYFRLSDGYEVKFHGKRPVKITDPFAFLKWLKTNVPAEEVALFIGNALIKKEVQRFIEKWCDDQRTLGVINPSVDGVDISEINFRRLTTSLTKTERKK